MKQANIQSSYKMYINPGLPIFLRALGLDNFTPKYSQGIKIYLDDNDVLYDFTSGNSVLNLGHNHSSLKESNIKQKYFSNYGQAEAELTKSLKKLFPDCYAEFFYVNSGAEAIDLAIKLAYLQQNSRDCAIVYAHNSYHGRLYSSLSISGADASIKHYFLNMPSCIEYEYGNFESFVAATEKWVSKNANKKVAAVIVEPVCAEYLSVPQPSFFSDLSKYCRKNNILMVADEIFMGFGRTGSMFSFEYYDWQPDIIAISKSLGGGMSSLAALAVSSHLRAACATLTNSSLLPSVAKPSEKELEVARKSVEIIARPAFLALATSNSTYLRNQLKILAQECESKIESFHCVGLLASIHLRLPYFFRNSLVPSFLKKTLSRLLICSVVHYLSQTRRVLTLPGADNQLSLTINPSITTTKFELDILFNALRFALKRSWYALFTAYLKYQFLLRKKKPLTPKNTAKAISLVSEECLPFTCFKASTSYVKRVTSIEDVSDAIHSAKKLGLKIGFRGASHSFGDCMLNDHGMVIDCRYFNKILEFDSEKGKIKVEPGVTCAQIFRHVAESGWYLASTPGEGSVTCAGAMANNVHGKDSFFQGGFIDQVETIKVIGSDNKIYTFAKSDEAFSCFFGSFGVLGCIIEIGIQLKAIPNPYIVSNIFSANCFQDLLDKCEELAKTNHFIVGWIDFYASGKNTGRGLLSAASWETQTELLPTVTPLRKNPPVQKIKKQKRWLFSLLFPLTTQFTVRIFNCLNFWFHSTFTNLNLFRKRELFLKYNDFCTKIPHTQHFAGKEGALEIQLTLPKHKAQEIFLLLHARCVSEKLVPIMSVFKKMKKDEATISFSSDGYNLTLEFLLRNEDSERVHTFASSLCEQIIQFGGKAYLAKDYVLSKKGFWAMYPQANKVLQLKNKLDKDNVFNNEMYQRLAINDDF